MDSKYCYPGTNVLINKLGIKDIKKLHVLERDMTDFKTLVLQDKGIKEPFNFDCLKNVHRTLFGNLYPFAGKVRGVDIAKSNLFCRAVFVEDQANFIFRKLNRDNYLKGLDKHAFIGKLTDYMADVNALHPFREGNGRTQRLFFDALAKNAGYEINFEKMNKEALLNADIEAMNGRTDKLKEILSENCSSIFEDLSKKIQSGKFSPEDVEQFNRLQSERLGNSIEEIKKDVPGHSVPTLEEPEI